MTAAARTKADRCFALARSKTFPAERETAIERGIKIAEAAGLLLDLFDIPGRAKTSAPKPPPSRYTDDLFRASKAPPHYTAEEAADVMRRFNEHMASDAFAESMRSTSEAMRRAAENIARQQAEALKRQRETLERKREAERRQWADLADKVANVLWALGWRVYQDAPGEDGRRRWHVTNPNGSTFENVGDERLCGLGMEHGAIDRIADELRAKAEAMGGDRCPKCGGWRVKRGFFSVCPACS